MFTYLGSKPHQTPNFEFNKKLVDSKRVDFNQVNKDWVIQHIQDTSLDNSSHMCDLFSSLVRLQCLKEDDFLDAIHGRTIESPDVILHILSLIKSRNLFNDKNKSFDGFSILKTFSAEFFNDDDQLLTALKELKSHQLLDSLLIVATQQRYSISNDLLFMKETKFDLVARIFKSDSTFMYHQLPFSIRTPDLQKYLSDHGFRSRVCTNHNHWPVNFFDFFSDCCNKDFAD